MNVWYCVLAMIAGSLIPLQAGINAQLRQVLNSPFYATLVSVLVSSAAVGLYCMVTRASLPDVAVCARAPWWVWSGGVLGVVLVCVSLYVAPKLGATTMVAAIVAGQMICSVILDHFGLVGYQQQSLSMPKLAGIALLIGGMVLIQRQN